MMLHYLFTNDLRRNEWPDILVESAELIRDGKVPDQNQDKSKNNYINTQQSYLCIHKGSKANEACCNGKADAVILNFIDHFQFPNARTQESFNAAIADGMAIAPLRLAIQLLFVLNLIDGKEAHISREEFAKYIICDINVAKGSVDVLALAQEIVSDRNAHVIMPPVPDTKQLLAMGIEWKHCPRQINELFKILQFAPFVESCGETAFSFVMPNNIDASLAKMFFYLVNNRKMWVPPTGANWQDVQESYLAYMDAGIAQYMSDSSAAQNDYRGEFVFWMVDVEKKSKSTAENYISYLSSLNKPPSNPINNNSTWPGIYPYLFGEKSPKEVYEVGTLAEFDKLFGPFRKIFDGSGCPIGVNPQAYQSCVAWANQVACYACLDSAFKAYRKFLEWREQQQEKKEELPLNADRLSIALNVFEERRGLAVDSREETYDASTARIRAQGQTIDGDYLVNCDYASFRKTLHDRQVANSYFTKHTDEDKRKLGEFMAGVRSDPKDVSHYIDKENWPQVPGIGAMLLTAFLARVRPDLYAFYSNPMFVVAKLLGMTRDEKLPQMTLSSYNAYKGVQTVIRDRMREMGIKAENGNDADYLTVNEFTWFVYANLDLVKDAMLPELRVPENVDRLSIALKQFANKRKEDGKDGWLEAGRAVNGRIREYFDPLTEEAIGAFGEEQIEELFCGKKSADGKVELVTMWSGKNGQGWSHIKKGLDDGKRHEIVGYLVSLKHDLEIASRFCLPDFDWHYGFGRSVISELLMKFHPENCIKHGERSYSALSWLRLIDFPWARKYSSEEYSQVCGAAAKILAKMKAMDMPRQINADGTGDDSPPDYLTVNEFLYFVDTNLDKIKEEVMSKQLKPVNSKEKIKKGTRTLEDAFKDDEMLKRLAAALRTKPFAILAGHSGTGKSRLVRRLAYMTCNNELLVAEGAGKAAPGNYCMVQVKPNWHDSTDLLGYYSEMGGRHFVNTPFVQFICKAYAYPDTPFFVCLDEMNLAPVEQYFAEYLSAVESMEKKGDVWVTDLLVEIDKTGEKDAEGREKIDADILGQIMKGAASTEAAEWIQKHGLTIPKNLFVVGTVNVDETTSQFPRKVLDRAMTLLMNEVRFADMANSKSPSEEALLDEPGLKFFLERDDRTVGERESKLLDGINAPLVNTPFMVAYRFGNEYALYEAALAKLDGVDLASADEPKQDEIARRALDHVVMMKLLPRIHGEKVEVKNIFSGYDRKKEGGAAEHVDGLKNKLPSDGLSVAMMDKILARDDEYLTFWP